MEKKEIISSISAWGQGEIYLGVVGAVRTGKSTFIKKVIENLIIPNIKDEDDKKRCLDETPQSAPGKTIMTTEPKFVPSTGATITIDEFTTNIKLIDCVGYVIKSSNGYEDDLGNPRLVKTPWYDEEIPFIEAAEIGTEKVIRDHSTIGIVITTDGSIGEFT
ncbi:MAG: stage IV sporulation protein A, partial [Bacilli bacterium]|nr:stage IV sporulation protein A [Bacilli bacterium]